MGGPDYPNASTIAALIKASEVTVEMVRPTEGPNQSWQLKLQMPSFSVASVSF
jgi:hypothetical protein